MSTPAPANSAPRAVDAAALVRARQRLSRAAQAPWLHGEVARRMADRLPVIRHQPSRVLNWDAGLGASAALLAQTYPRAEILAVEHGLASATAAGADDRAPWWSARRWRAARPAIDADAVPAGSAGLLWSNMGLHFVADPQLEMQAWHQALAVEGFLMFSTLGPGTLRGLSALYAQQGWPAPLAPLVDMHDLGDMLIAAGFADPVMDQETLTLTWPSASALRAELRELGANADPRRGSGLRTPRWRDRLDALLAAQVDHEGRIAMEFELVYGHAFRPLPRPRLAAHTEVPLADLQAMARSPRRKP
jgi:malonyl-CoA O-methyltransferase